MGSTGVWTEKGVADCQDGSGVPRLLEQAVIVTDRGVLVEKRFPRRVAYFPFEDIVAVVLFDSHFLRSFSSPLNPLFLFPAGFLFSRKGNWAMLRGNFKLLIRTESSSARQDLRPQRSRSLFALFSYQMLSLGVYAQRHNEVADGTQAWDSLHKVIHEERPDLQAAPFRYFPEKGLLLCFLFLFVAAITLVAVRLPVRWVLAGTICASVAGFFVGLIFDRKALVKRLKGEQ